MEVYRPILLLLAIIASANARIQFIRIRGKFLCQGRSLGNTYIEVKEHETLVDRLFVRDHLRDGVIDVVTSGGDWKFFGGDDGMELYVRVYYDCGCGAYWQTKWAPKDQFYDTEAEARAKPWDLGVIDIYEKSLKWECS